MNNIKKKALKGFTLIELIIVMAVFGLLLIAVISIANPVSRIFRNTESAEKSYAYSNNIQLYLQNKLEYADNMVVYTENDLPKPLLSDLATDYINTYYKDIVTKDTGTIAVNLDASEYMDGKLYIMRLANHDSSSEFDSDNRAIRKGQIYLYSYDFNTNTGLRTANADAVPQLADAYFRAGDAKFDLNYALGAQELKSVTVPGTSERFRAIENDVPEKDENGDFILDDAGNVVEKKIAAGDINFKNFAISIIASKKMESKDNTAIANAGMDTLSFELYKDPTSISVANIPLLNMNFRAVTTTATRVIMEHRYQKVLVPDEKNAEGFVVKPAYWDIQLQDGTTDSFVATDIYDTLDMSQDIYIVFSYGDELVEHR